MNSFGFSCRVPFKSSQKFYDKFTSAEHIYEIFHRASSSKLFFGRLGDSDLETFGVLRLTVGMKEILLWFSFSFLQKFSERSLLSTLLWNRPMVM